MPDLPSFRDELAHDLIPQGMTPVEHRTTGGVRYIMYVLADTDPELPYVHDPICGDCGCDRTLCGGPPPFGWDDLVPEGACNHHDDKIPGYIHPVPSQGDPQ